MAIKPQGYMIFTIRESHWLEDGYKERMNRMESEGLVKLVQDTEYMRFQNGLEVEICKPSPS